jgi:transcription elongation factor Elf1
MTASLDYQVLQCPYCGELIEVAVDVSGGDQDYIEDCSVCCRPIELAVRQSASGVHVEARRDDE